MEKNNPMTEDKTMNSRNLFLKFFQITVLSSAVFLSSNTNAAPGTLPKSPLFLTNAVEPNVFFTLDDSGSMDWEQMLEGGIVSFPVDEGIPEPFFGTALFYWHPMWHLDAQIIPPATWTHPDPTVTADDEMWVLRNHNANKLYYNPEIDYVPWAGASLSGTPLYQNANPTSVLETPSNPLSRTTNITQRFNYINRHVGTGNTILPDAIYLPSYFTWTDSNGNGRIDVTDTHTLIEITPATASYPSGRNYTDEMQNFANWFQFYRKREYSAKAAVGAVINNSGATRMGLDIFNLGHRKDLKTMSVPTNKLDLLNTFYNTNSSGGTPARTALNRVGSKFKSTTSGFILPAADGGECQQNFNILMTDGFWNERSFSFANEDISPSTTDTIFDGNQSESIDGGNYADSFSNTLADVAMYYYESDLRSDLADKVPVNSSVDLAPHQHLVTYSISFGLTGTLNPETVSPLDIGFAWPNPAAGDAQKIDDLWHAAYNSRGQFLSAQNPVELEAALSSTIKNIAERTATAAAVAVNSARLTSESVVYLAQFNSNRWQGNLFAFPIIDLNIGTLSETPKWEANSLLTNRDLTAEPRQIITFNGTKGVPFRWDTTTLSSEMLNDFRTSPSGATDSDTNAEARLNYIRGDRSNEGRGLQLRPRLTILGDIVNSGPVFVGEPSLNWPDTAPFPTTTGNRYSDFKNGAAKNRIKVVYVGANDGLLHAFDDDTGKELFAYASNALSTNDATGGYHFLSNPNYTHNWYVDQTPTLSDINITSNSTTGWHTVLVGALGAGGRGLFALDVTNPANLLETNAENNVLWEFTNSNDSDLGYTYSRPSIALANNGRWVAIIGNGYNDTGSGEASLFILDIEAGIDGWVATDYKKITTKAGTAVDRNGLATPALADVDGNGTVDRVYAGDLEGNMWVFDLSSSNKTQWDVAFKTGSTPAPLFKAPAGQPITSKPVLARHPTIPFSTSPSNSPNLMVYFGTGSYLVENDKTNTSTQSFYGVWDQGDDSLGRAKLIEQTFKTGFTNRVLTRNFVDYSTDYGWWFDLPSAGERSVTSSIARTDTVFFNSFIPLTAPCSVGGFGFRFSVDMVTGGSPKEPVADHNNDGSVSPADNIEDPNEVIAAIRQEGYLPEPVFIEDLVFTGAIAEKIKKQPFVPTGRFSWQELIKK